MPYFALIATELSISITHDIIGYATVQDGDTLPPVDLQQASADQVREISREEVDPFSSGVGDGEGKWERSD